ncbi:MAG: Uma2 family endonuclease [Acidobacteriota bacterium]|nr:Uma2 family endonuclease [Acidobacteriota bacterium]
MNWAEVVAHPSLRDLPFKIETDEHGQIIMNPVKINHSFYQGRISSLIQNMRADGVVLVECAIRTKRGTKCADVAWASAELFAQIENKTEAHIAPEVCVEVVSMSNSEKEMREKRKLYFEQGAREVWICDEYGALRFFDESGEMERSEMFADFPKSVSSTAR